jgi:hypothetical protein
MQLFKGFRRVKYEKTESDMIRWAMEQQEGLEWFDDFSICLARY